MNEGEVVAFRPRPVCPPPAMEYASDSLLATGPLLASDGLGSYVAAPAPRAAAVHVAAPLPATRPLASASIAKESLPLVRPIAATHRFVPFGNAADTANTATPPSLAAPESATPLRAHRFVPFSALGEGAQPTADFVSLTELRSRYGNKNDEPEETSGYDDDDDDESYESASESIEYSEEEEEEKEKAPPAPMGTGMPLYDMKLGHIDARDLESFDAPFKKQRRAIAGVLGRGSGGGGTFAPYRSEGRNPGLTLEVATFLAEVATSKTANNGELVALADNMSKYKAGRVSQMRRLRIRSAKSRLLGTSTRRSANVYTILTSGPVLDGATIVHYAKLNNMGSRMSFVKPTTSKTGGGFKETRYKGQLIELDVTHPETGKMVRLLYSNSVEFATETDDAAKATTWYAMRRTGKAFETYPLLAIMRFRANVQGKAPLTDLVLVWAASDSIRGGMATQLGVADLSEAELALGDHLIALADQWIDTLQCSPVASGEHDQSPHEALGEAIGLLASVVPSNLGLDAVRGKLFSTAMASIIANIRADCDALDLDLGDLGERVTGAARAEMSQPALAQAVVDYANALANLQKGVGTEFAMARGSALYEHVLSNLSPHLDEETSAAHLDARHHYLANLSLVAIGSLATCFIHARHGEAVATELWSCDEIPYGANEQFDYDTLVSYFSFMHA